MFEFALDNSQQRNSDFHLACLRGNNETAVRLLDEGADVDTVRSDMPALLVALHNGHLEIARELVKRGAKTNCANFYNWTPMHVAASTGNAEMVRLLNDNGAAVNCPDNGGETPIYVAAKGDHAFVVDALLEMGADPRIENKDRDTCMHWCARNGNILMAGKISAKGAFANVVNAAGESPDSCAKDPETAAAISQMELTKKVDSVLKDQRADLAEAGADAPAPVAPAKRRILKA